MSAVSAQEDRAAEDDQAHQLTVLEVQPCPDTSGEEVVQPAPAGKDKKQRRKQSSPVSLTTLGLLLVLCQPACADYVSMFAVCKHQQDYTYFKDKASTGCYQGELNYGVGSACELCESQLTQAQQSTITCQSHLEDAMQQLEGARDTIEQSTSEATISELQRQLARYIREQEVQRQHEKELERAVTTGVGRPAQSHPISVNIGPKSPTVPAAQHPQSSGGGSQTAMAAAGIFSGVMALGALIMGVIRAVRVNGVREGVRETVADPVARENARVAVAAAKDLADRYASARAAIPPPPRDININLRGAAQADVEDPYLGDGAGGSRSSRPRM